MAPEPSLEQIQTVKDCTNLGDSQSKILLKKYNNDVSQAVSAYYDDPYASVQPVQEDNTWQAADNLPAFRIDADDTMSSSVRGAVSRPPSAASYGNEPHDMATEHGAANSGNGLTLQQQEDQELARAIALSRGEDLPAQENGVTGTGQQFGPATQSHYEMSQWAVTVSNATSHELIDHPPPAKRRRVADEPVFLRGAKESGYLPSLLTIYHSIPLAREALLLPNLEVHSYSHSPNWWSGTTEPDSNALATSVSNPHNINPDFLNVLIETQSLMAFLDKTSRAYGSIDTLTSLPAYRLFNAESPTSRFLELWKASAMAVSEDDPLTQIFTSRAFKAPVTNGSFSSEPPLSKSFSCLEPTVYQMNGHTLYDVLDQAVWSDNTDSPMDDVWLDQLSDIFTMHLYDPRGDSESLDVRIPPVFYPDRYLEEFKQTSREMRQKKLDISREYTRLERIQQQCKSIPAPDGRILHVREVLETARRVTKIAVKSNLPNGVHEGHQPSLAESVNVTVAQANEAEANLEQIVGRIDRKLQMLEQRKEEAQAAERAVSRQMTQPGNPTDGRSPYHKYTLQGISTKPHIIYIRRPVVEDLIDVDGDKSEEPSESPDEDGEEAKRDQKWQWWRISFSRDDAHSSNDTEPVPPGPVTGPRTQAEAMAMAEEMSALTSFAPPPGPPPSKSGVDSADWSRKINNRNPYHAQAGGDTHGYTIRKLRQVEVLKAARQESNSVLLVYASERSMDFSLASELTEELETFVRRDDDVFEVELRAELGHDEANQPWGQAAMAGDSEGQADTLSDVMTLTEGPGSTVAAAANAARLTRTRATTEVSSDTFTTLGGLEMTPLSISSPKRDANFTISDDEQMAKTASSPKRPKSSGGGHAVAVDMPDSMFVVGTAADEEDEEEEEPPPYQEMEELRSPNRSAVTSSGSRIGLHAERMMERFGGGGGGAGGGGAAAAAPEGDSTPAATAPVSADVGVGEVHIEHSMEPMR